VLHFEVSDTGVGVPVDKQHVIFDAFTQADGSTTRKYGGTGLGLTIASQLVAMRGGEIWIESESGKGSTFHFTAAFGLSEVERTAVAQLEVGMLRDVRVLVVDDNSTNRLILTEMLRKWCMRPLAVADGPAALDALRLAVQEREPFAVSLLDVQMPGMDGFSLAREIRKDPQLSSTPVVFLTSTGERGDEERWPGRVEYLMKPVSASELFNTIQCVVGKKPAPKTPTPGDRQPLKPNSKRLRVLLAEDAPVNRKVAVRLLERLGHDVVAVENGHQALAALEKERYDVVLMDVQMPGIDGLEATAAIRAKEGNSGTHIPIVALTAHALKGDRERFLSSGMDAYLSKPIDAKALYETLEPLCAWGATGCANPQAAPDTVLDRDALWERVADADLLRELVEIFFEDKPKMLADLESSLSRSDPAAVARAAHRLKGSLQTIGATAASRVAFRLEEMGRDGDLSQAEEAWSALQYEMERLDPELESMTKTEDLS
ncbi:MAG: response regulator, partial [Acidobacteriota bacterium]